MARHGAIIIETIDLEIGDLVFFTNIYPTSKFITHVGIYLWGTILYTLLTVKEL